MNAGNELSSDGCATPPRGSEETLPARGRSLARPRPRAVALGVALVVGLTFLLPYVNLSLNKYDWAFRPLALGPLFILCALIWPVNSVLQRIRPAWAFTGPELLLVYAMMAISAAISGEGLFVYAMVNAVQPLFFASPGNRWAEVVLPHVPTWLLVAEPHAVTWFYEGAPDGASLPWRPWVSPISAWALFAFSLYVVMFCLACLLRKDWIEAQRLAFPLAAVPLEVASDPIPSGRSRIFRNPMLWVGFSLPVMKSLLQMANAFSPAVPYRSLYWPLRPLFGNVLPWSAISDTTVYVGFETIGILALVPAEISLSLWGFFFLNRLQLLAFAALGFGEEGLSASGFSPRAFVRYQGAGACLMMAALILWYSRGAIAGAFRSLFGAAAPRDPLSPISPRAAAFGMLLAGASAAFWAHRTGMEAWVFVVLMTVFVMLSLVVGRLVAAGGIFAPALGMGPVDLLLGLTGAARYSGASRTMMMYLDTTLMQEWKVNFFHFAMNDLKVAHSARLPGRLVGWVLLVSVVLMLSIVPWTMLQAAYSHGAFSFNPWQFQDRQTYALSELVTEFQSPSGPAPSLPWGLLCGAVMMFLLNWLHSNFLWWSISPLGFAMSDSHFMNIRIWANALIAWTLVVLIRRFGGLPLYRKVRPAFLGMVLGHFVIFGLRSFIDPLLGLDMQLSSWA
jgi:hypothetical protein